jgi:hypothetical protein
MVCRIDPRRIDDPQPQLSFDQRARPLLGPAPGALEPLLGNGPEWQSRHSPTCRLVTIGAAALADRPARRSAIADGIADDRVGPQLLPGAAMRRSNPARPLSPKPQPNTSP